MNVIKINWIIKLGSYLVIQIIKLKQGWSYSSLLQTMSLILVTKKNYKMLLSLALTKSVKNSSIILNSKMILKEIKDSFILFLFKSLLSMAGSQSIQHKSKEYSPIPLLKLQDFYLILGWVIHNHKSLLIAIAM